MRTYLLYLKFGIVVQRSIYLTLYNTLAKKGKYFFTGCFSRINFPQLRTQRGE